jgi:hypothetical protein
MVADVFGGRLANSDLELAKSDFSASAGRGQTTVPQTGLRATLAKSSHAATVVPLAFRLSRSRPWPRTPHKSRDCNVPFFRGDRAGTLGEWGGEAGAISRPPDDGEVVDQIMDGRSVVCQGGCLAWRASFTDQVPYSAQGELRKPSKRSALPCAIRSRSAGATGKRSRNCRAASIDA